MSAKIPSAFDAPRESARNRNRISVASFRVLRYGVVVDMQILLEDLGTSWGCFRDILGLKWFEHTIRLMKHGRSKSFQVNSMWNPFMLASPLDSCGCAL